MTLTDGAVNPPIAGEEDATDNKRIKALIVSHLESYLSPENLKNDASLANIAVNGKVAVNALSRIQVIRNLTSDRELLLEALLESSKFELDPSYSWVTIKKKQRERNVLILREIPTETPVEEIKEIFTGFTDLPEIKSIHSDIGNNWFITFNNQDDCMAAALKLSTEGKFKGESLKVRVKAILAQAEQQSKFTTPASPIRGPQLATRSGPLMSSYNTSPSYHPGPVYPNSPMRGRGMGSRGMSTPRRRGVAYPPTMVIGSPRQHMMTPPSHHASLADYPGHFYTPSSKMKDRALIKAKMIATSTYRNSDRGNFRLFTPENMRQVIRSRYESKIADKPISLDSDEVRDIVTNRPKNMCQQMRTRPAGGPSPGNGSPAGGREEVRKQDRQRRKKSNASRRNGDNGGRPGGGTAQGSKPRVPRGARRRGGGRGRREPMK